MIISTEIIDNHTDDASLWHGIAAGHDTINFMFGELFDDSLSSIYANACKEQKVILTISENIPNGWNSDYIISVEDSGAGIKNPSACMSFANTEAGETPLNRYGVGLKKVLATFDPTNKLWSIKTRNLEDAERGCFRLIEAPYRLDEMKMSIIQGEAWNGALNGSGTLITFPCSETIMSSAEKDYPNHEPVLNEYVKNINEELSVIYMPYIRDGLKIITNAISKDRGTYSTVLPYITPRWNEKIKRIKIETEIDFGGGLCKVSGEFGAIEDHSDTARYFQKNFNNSGVMVYINGRLIESNIFSQIWKNKIHPSYNAFLGIVEIESLGDASALPSPTPTKDALYYGDPKVKELLKWIRSVCPNPKSLINGKPQGERGKKKKERKHEEHNRRGELVKRLRAKYGADAIIDTEKPFFYNVETNLPRVDIYMFAENEVSLIECKAYESSALDVGQLRMYHDGALHDGIEPKVLWLVAESHPETVKEYVKHLNKGNNSWRYELKTWSDFSIA